MKKTLNRKEFLTLGLSTAAVGVVGCASGDDGDDTTTGMGANSGGGPGSGGASSGGSTATGAGGMTTGSGGDSTGSGSGGDSTGSGSGGDSTGSGSGGDSTGSGSGGDSTGSGSGGDSTGAGTCMTPTSEIGTNHMHAFAMEVSEADVTAGAEKMYDIKGASTHPHTVILTAANFMTLSSAGTVTVMSSTDNGHSHEVTITCATA